MIRIRNVLRLLFVIALVFALTLPLDTYGATKLNKSKATVRIGKTVKLKVKAAKKKVKWSSSNKAIAKVSKSGKVKGLKVGMVKITAKTGGTTLVCKVKVIPKPSLSKTSITLSKGGSETLTVNYPTKTVKWSSSNKKVAKVNNKGKVVAISEGTAKITAKCGNYRCVCKVVVKKKPAISKTKMDLQIGKSATLEILNWNGVVTWTSSNPAVVTVDGRGKVTAVGVGGSIITATCGNYTFNCKVTVKQPTISKTTITIAKYKEYQLKVNNYDTPGWKSSNPAVAKVNGGKVTAVSPGIATISAYAGPFTLNTLVKVVYPPPTAANYIAIQKIYHQGYKKYGKYFFYSFPKSESTYDKALNKVRNNKKTGSTCVVPARWGLIDMGLSSKGFYVKNGKFQAYTNKNAYWTLITKGGPVGMTFTNAVKKKKLKKGDLIAFKDRTHTIIYSGDGYYVYEGGAIPNRLGYNKVGIKIDYRKYYKKDKISQVIRWKK